MCRSVLQTPAGVCRTDLHIIEGVWKHIQDPDGKLLPCVMGHENAGWIEDVGKDVTEFKKGDPVILHPLISGTDGTCLDCRRGNDMHAAAGAPAAACMSLPRLQSRHVPSVPDISGCKITGSPFLNSVTSFPTSSIQPAFS